MHEHESEISVSAPTRSILRPIGLGKLRKMTGTPFDPAVALAAFDRQIRRSLDAPLAGWLVEQAGAVIRTTSPPLAPHGCFVTWSDLDAASADRAIHEQVTYFASLDDGHGRNFEWKLFGHDEPADLADRLTAAGFVAEDVETLVIGLAREIVATAGASSPPALPGLTIREVSEATLDHDLARIGAMHEAVWGGDFSWLMDELRVECLADPSLLRIHLAEAPGPGGEPLVLSSAWLRLRPGTEFASLWGGSTLAEWRGKGLYRELVRRRAQQAVEAGFRYLQVDTSPDSRPILERLGFHVVTWTQPYVWSPRAA